MIQPQALCHNSYADFREWQLKNLGTINNSIDFQFELHCSSIYATITIEHVQHLVKFTPIDVVISHMQIDNAIAQLNALYSKSDNDACLQFINTLRTLSK